METHIFFILKQPCHFFKIIFSIAVHYKSNIFILNGTDVMNI